MQYRHRVDRSGGRTDIAVGDLVQWEANGLLQFERPRTVRALREHEGQDWVFVEGSETGLPLHEVILERKGRTGFEAVREGQSRTENRPVSSFHTASVDGRQS